jgi:hypothetical protein
VIVSIVLNVIVALLKAKAEKNAFVAVLEGVAPHIPVSLVVELWEKVVEKLGATHPAVEHFGGRPPSSWGAPQDAAYHLHDPQGLPGDLPAPLGEGGTL